MILDILVVGPLETNCYIVGDADTNEVLIIDPGSDQEKIYRHIIKKEYHVKYIVLTHGHIDHIGAVKYLKEKTGADIAIHQADSNALINGDKNLSFLMGFNSTQVPADLLLENNQELNVGGYNFKVIYTPGHTPGGICLLTNNVLFSGDTLFFESIGRTDLPGGNFDQLLDSINNRLLALNDNICVYPGHGSKTDIGHERKYNPFIR